MIFLDFSHLFSILSLIFFTFLSFFSFLHPSYTFLRRLGGGGSKPPYACMLSSPGCPIKLKMQLYANKWKMRLFQGARSRWHPIPLKNHLFRISPNVQNWCFLGQLKKLEPHTPGVRAWPGMLTGSGPNVGCKFGTYRELPLSFSHFCVL